MTAGVDVDVSAALPATGVGRPGLGSRDFGGSPKTLRNLSPMRDLERIAQDFEDLRRRRKRLSCKPSGSISAALEQTSPIVCFGGKTRRFTVESEFGDRATWCNISLTAASLVLESVCDWKGRRRTQLSGSVRGCGSCLHADWTLPARR